MVCVKIPILCSCLSHTAGTFAQFSVCHHVTNWISWQEGSLQGCNDSLDTIVPTDNSRTGKKTLHCLNFDTDTEHQPAQHAKHLTQHFYFLFFFLFTSILAYRSWTSFETVIIFWLWFWSPSFIRRSQITEMPAFLLKFTVAYTASSSSLSMPL